MATKSASGSKKSSGKSKSRSRNQSQSQPKDTRSDLQKAGETFAEASGWLLGIVGTVFVKKKLGQTLGKYF
jgi:hypothetical protein